MRRIKMQSEAELRRERKDKYLSRFRHLEGINNDELLWDECDGLTPNPWAKRILYQLNSGTISIGIIREARNSLKENEQILDLPPEVLHVLIAQLTRDDVNFLTELVGLIRQICKHRLVLKALVEQGVISHLSQLLKTHSCCFNLTSQIIALYGNICQESRELRNMIMTPDYLEFLFQYIGKITSQWQQLSVEEQKFGVDLQRSISYNLYIYVSGTNIMQYRIECMFPAFVHLLNFDDTDITSNILNSLEKIANGIENLFSNQYFLQLVFMKQNNNFSLFEVLCNKLLVLKAEDNILKNLWFLRNLSVHEEARVVILQTGVQSKIFSLFEHSNLQIQTEACRLVTELVSDPTSISSCMPDILKSLQEIFYMFDSATQVEALHILRRITERASLEQMLKIIEEDFLKQLAQFLDCQNIGLATSLQIYQNLFKAAAQMGCLDNVIERCDQCPAYEKIELLERHPNPEIVTFVKNFLIEFYPE